MCVCVFLGERNVKEISALCIIIIIIIIILFFFFFVVEIP